MKSLIWILAGSAAAVPLVSNSETKVINIPAIETQPPRGNEPGAAPPLVNSATTGVTTHGAYSGTPTTTGAEQYPSTLAATIPIQPNPTATYYNPNGKLTEPMPMPYMPAGGVGTNGTVPVYMVQSDLTTSPWLWASTRNISSWTFSTMTVREFIDFNVKLTRWGESGTWGWLSHLDSKEVATLVVEAEAIEARQQSIFRQLLGLQPMPIWFAAGIPQSWHWTLLAQYISSCPANNTRLVWQNFPNLHVVNQANPNRINANATAAWEVVGNRTSDPSNSTIPAGQSCVHNNVTGYNCGPAISRDKYDPLTFPGRKVELTWDEPGRAVGPNNSYVTSTTAGKPSFVAWLSQLNLTYTELKVTGENKGYTYQPASEVFETDPALNGTAFIALTDTDMFVTPYNLTILNPHIRALGLYQAG
ncbi:hypothetical protein LV164_005804 [Aspergillus fumigatus]|nr:hypothetical protein KXX42_008754 [Aspergillus fumigatus]KAH1545640.1 hypothetical protein KXX57_004423 [Aspergillus fumigatus]KAH2304268.1 hypothetical protein KXV47_009186 [Aspergillus fumigatus]KAH2755997.1 hypothetical protein KXV94_009492 [Aspergillus fumigatus]KAH3190736.1 hypothetical protein KXV92_003189 [Aspergillus fumigatus]